MRKCENSCLFKAFMNMSICASSYFWCICELVLKRTFIWRRILWFYRTLLVLHQEPLFGMLVKLAVSASAECELNLSSKQHNNNNSQVHSGLPANFHYFVLPSYSVRSQLFLCLSCLDPSIVRTWAGSVEDGGVLKDDIFSWEKKTSA